MNSQKTRDVFEQIINSLDIPESAYKKAADRYKDLGNWFERGESGCAQFSPHIRPQGSFRLGTVNRPLNEKDDYDLDMGCRLRVGISKSTHTQKDLKKLVGNDLKAYRDARRIESQVEEKHRCWRLEYADEMSFHMDVVPSIPEEAKQTRILMDQMVKSGSARDLAEDVTKHAGAITDNRTPSYERISNDWKISNSEGYALWFESRIKLAQSFLVKRAFDAKVAKVEELPAWQWKAPLQQVVQILKRHRDVMFEDDSDGQPISIIITTLAAEAYRGELDVVEALKQVLSDMESYVRPTKPRVPNPVNPIEDFADKWSDAKYSHLRLEQKFRLWVQQAQRDVSLLEKTEDLAQISEYVQSKFAVRIDSDCLRNKWGVAVPSIVTQPKSHVISSAPARPWMKD